MCQRLFLISITFVYFSLFTTFSVFADLPDAPVILDFSPAGCIPAQELCGDGIDQDCNGSDLSCEFSRGNPLGGNSGIDADFDGYQSDADCNDSDNKVYPSVSVSCSGASGCSGVKTCGSNGSFSACSCEPLCEATGSGTCRYISKLTGSDSNPGTFSQPWKTLHPISNSVGGAPVNVTLQAGDVVYVMSGLFDETYQWGQFRVGFGMSNLQGTAANPITLKAYPGAHPVIAPKTNAYGGFLFNVAHFIIDGFEIRDSWEHGLRFTDWSHDVELKNLWVHNNKGVDNHNTSGLRFDHTSGIKIHHSIIHDNYDRVNTDTAGKATENSRNIVFLKGSGAEVYYNTIFNSPPTTADKTGSCIGYKHPAEGPGTFSVHHNLFRNCFDAAVQVYTSNGHFYNNLILDSPIGFKITTSGEPGDVVNHMVEFNTFVNTRALVYRPSQFLAAGYNTGPVTYRNNIAVFSGPYNTDLGGVLEIDNYGADIYYDQMTAGGRINFSNNCYYNPGGPVSISLYAANDTPSRIKGGLYNMTQWQAQQYDAGSKEINPQLNAQHKPQEPQCQSSGIYAD